MDFVNPSSFIFDQSQLFNNREISAGVWLAVAAIISVKQVSIRRSVCSVVRSFLSPYVFSVFALAFVYILAVNLMLMKFDMWELSIAKDSAIWFVVGAIGSIMVSATKLDITSSFKARLVALVKLSFLMELVVGFKSFPLLVELLLVPILTFVLLSLVLIEYKPELRRAKSTMESIGAILGLVLVGYGVFSVVTEIHNLNAWDIIQGILLVPILAIVFIPYLYMVALYSGYDQMFRRVSAFSKDRGEVRRYAMLRLGVRINIRITVLSHLLGEHSNELMRIGDRDDVDSLIYRASCH